MTFLNATRAVLFVAGFSVCMATALPANAQPRDAIVGIDHIPLAVRDLNRASDTFRGLGFTLKPGRQHRNGIRNNHVKFPDGSGIELITSTARTDAVDGFYSDFLNRGDGPAFISFHCRSTPQLLLALSNSRIACIQKDGIILLQDPRLDFVFIVSDNRSPTDLPEHFDHRNGAFAMTEVWIALDDPAPLQQLLTALGAVETREKRNVPEPVEAIVLKLENGSIVLVPAKYQFTIGRPVIGVAMSVHRTSGSDCTSIGPVKGALTPVRRFDAFDRLIGPDRAHGIWIAFEDER